jgi:hypothetical protein
MAGDTTNASAHTALHSCSPLLTFSAYTLKSVEPTNTRSPNPIPGVPTTESPVANDQTTAPPDPDKLYTRPSLDPTITAPVAHTAGDDATLPPVTNVHSTLPTLVDIPYTTPSSEPT